MERKEHSMSNSQENRVLGRAGARLLSEEELQQISGGFHTSLCSNDPTTGAIDGDCLIPPA
jgi:bacteriocin-like protein